MIDPFIAKDKIIRAGDISSNNFVKPKRHNVYKLIRAQEEAISTSVSVSNKFASLEIDLMDTDESIQSSQTVESAPKISKSKKPPSFIIHLPENWEKYMKELQEITELELHYKLSAEYFKITAKFSRRFSNYLTLF